MQRIVSLLVTAAVIGLSLASACAPTSAPGPTAAPRTAEPAKPAEVSKPVAPTAAPTAVPAAKPPEPAKDQAAKPAAAAAASREGWPTEVRFALVPTENSADITGRWNPLFDYLGQKLGVPVKAQVATDYAAVTEAMRFDKAELAYFGPKSYVEAAERAKAEAIVLEDAIKSGQGYYGWIITRKDSPITSLEQAQGKNFAFVDPGSTSGYLVPLAHILLNMNTRPEQHFGKVAYSGSHEASILAVKNGSIDVAATNDLDFDRAVESGKVKLDEFNIIWKSELIPGSPIAVRGTLPASFKAAVTEALVGYKDPAGLEKLQLKGFVKTDDKTYDAIRKLNEAATKAKQG